MSTFAFSKTGSSISINTYTDPTPSGYLMQVDIFNNKLILSHHLGNIRTEVDADTDTITINGDAFSGTAAELKEQLEEDIFSGAGSSATEVVMYQLKTVLTHAQILGLATGTSVELVPAQGAGKLIYYHGATVRRPAFTAPYVISEFDKLYIEYTGSGGWVDQVFNYDTGTSPTVNSLNFLLASNTGSDRVYFNNQNVESHPEYGSVPTPILVADATNVGLSLRAEPIDTWSGGHADNTLEVTVFYSVVDL
jgi:hypothetical protein